MKPTEKAYLAVLIHELQEILEGQHCTSTFPLKSEIEKLLQSWIKANDLHPERVQTFGPFTTSNADSQYTTVSMEVTE